MTEDASRSFTGRWWTYQRERFPLLGHGPVILAFSASAVAYSALLRQPLDGPAAAPPPIAFLVAFAVCLGLFLQLRIADEHKDFAEDLAHRPYRPVQRGLVSLRELRVLFILIAVGQLGLAMLLSPILAGLLLVTWTYLALMSKEFFLGEALRARPILYLASHMLIMPLIDLFATGCDWTIAPSERPGAAAGLAWFLATSYGNGLAVELGRKIRVPADEEPGVETYSALWGRRVAIAAWLGACAAAGSCAIVAAWWIDFLWPMAIVVAGALLLAIATGASVLATDAPKAGKRIEVVAGLWTIGVSLTLGVAPLMLRVFSERGAA